MSIEKVIAEELTMSYVQAGRHISGENVAIVASALSKSIDFRTESEVREAFNSARNSSDIPTQKVLAEAMLVIRLKNNNNQGFEIDYQDRRKAWLPQSDNDRKRNFDTAVKRLCIAQGEKEYKRYIDATSTRYDEHMKIVYVNPVSAREFMTEKAELIKELYMKYLRTLPEYKDYPQNEKLNFGLLPPEVYQFREMLENEAKDYAWGEYV